MLIDQEFLKKLLILSIQIQHTDDGLVSHKAPEKEIPLSFPLYDSLSKESQHDDLKIEVTQS